MSILPFIGMYVSGGAGYAFCCILIALQGFANAIFQSNLFGIAGFLPFKFIIAVSYGNGIAGTFVGILQYILIFSYGIENSEKRDVVIATSYWFYSISISVLIFGVFVLIKNFTHPWFINELSNAGSVEFPEDTVQEVKSKYFSDEESKDALTKTEKNEKEDQEEESIITSFVVMMKQLYSLNLYVFLIFLTSFSVFPGLLFDLEL
jgi:hypothetical protein